MCVTVLSMQQSETTASSGFMIAEAQRRSGAYSDRHPDRMDSRLDRIGIGSDEKRRTDRTLRKNAVSSEARSRVSSGKTQCSRTRHRTRVREPAKRRQRLIGSPAAIQPLMPPSRCATRV